MSELFRAGTLIPKGFALAITSWENDGDDYKTLFIKGLQSKNITNEVLHVLGWFSHCRDDMGNDNIDHEEILTRLWSGIESGIITKEFFDLFLEEVEFPVIGDDYEHDNWLDRVAQSEGYEAVEEMVRNFCGIPEQYEMNHARMVENVKVHFFQEDFHVPDMPPAIAQFSGAWCERSKITEWKL